MSLMILTPNNEKLNISLTSIRENYILKLPVFIKNLKPVGTVDIRKVKNLIPENCILSPSDKNLGVTLLPPQWYQKEYQSQIIKGGYELQIFSESQYIVK